MGWARLFAGGASLFAEGIRRAGTVEGVTEVMVMVLAPRAPEAWGHEDDDHFSNMKALRETVAALAERGIRTGLVTVPYDKRDYSPRAKTSREYMDIVEKKGKGKVLECKVFTEQARRSLERYRDWKPTHDAHERRAAENKRMFEASGGMGAEEFPDIFQLLTSSWGFNREANAARRMGLDAEELMGGTPFSTSRTSMRKKVWRYIVVAGAAAVGGFLLSRHATPAPIVLPQQQTGPNGDSPAMKEEKHGQGLPHDKPLRYASEPQDRLAPENLEKTEPSRIVSGFDSAATSLTDGAAAKTVEPAQPANLHYIPDFARPGSGHRRLSPALDQAVGAPEQAVSAEDKSREIQGPMNPKEASFTVQEGNAKKLLPDASIDSPSTPFSSGRPAIKQIGTGSAQATRDRIVRIEKDPGQAAARIATA